MFLRFQELVRIGIVSALLAGACSNDDGGTGGAAGSAGMASAGTATGGSATSGAGSNAGNTAAGSTSGGSNGNGAAAGTAMGGAGAGAGSGSAGVSGGASGGASGSGGAAGNGGAGGSGGAGGKSKTTFFVTSDTSMTGKLGGLEGADKRCQDLATAAGIDHTFHAYLSTAAVNAKDRIGAGPWVNAKGLKVADNVAALHSTTKGDHLLFIDEKGMDINGQWNSSAGDKNEHDILTGSTAEGTVQAGKTCMDWTSDATDIAAQVGHSDGMGPGMATTGTYTSWNSSHENESCANTTPRGGKGRLYCFAID